MGSVPADVARDRRITLQGGSKFTLEEQSQRVSGIAAALIDLGYEGSDVAYIAQSQQIKADVRPNTAGALPSVAEIDAAASARLQNVPGISAAARRVSPEDITLTALSGAPIPPDAARGGASITGCTSGWVVEGFQGFSIATAGHCPDASSHTQPEAGGSTFAMTFQFQGANTMGDVHQWHTTPDSEPAEFYSEGTTVRAVSGTVNGSAAVGSTICFYGRSSNTRHCNYYVDSFPVSHTYPAPWGTMDNFARVTNPNEGNNPIIAGDSGGGYSYTFTAYGIHSGRNVDYPSCGGAGQPACYAYFTPPDIMAYAMTVQIRKQ